MNKKEKEELIKELYLRLLHSGPGYLNNSNIEFWDPTLDAIVILEELTQDLQCN